MGRKTRNGVGLVCFLKSKLHFWSMLKAGGGSERQGWGGEGCKVRASAPYMQSKSSDF